MQFRAQLDSYIGTLPPGASRWLAEEMVRAVDSARTVYQVFLSRRPSPDQISDTSRLHLAWLRVRSELLFPLFEARGGEVQCRGLTLSIQRRSPKGTVFLGLLPTVEVERLGPFMTVFFPIDRLGAPFSASEGESGEREKLGFFIRFPKAQDSDLLSLCILAHEVAHIWFHSYSIGEDLLKKIALDHEAMGQYAGRNGLKGREWESFKDTVVKIARAWTEEIFCDLLAAKVLGPSALFASSRFNEILGGYGEPSDTHPPGVWRMQILLRQLQRDGFDFWRGVPKKTSIPEIWGEGQRIRKEVDVQVGPLSPILYEFVFQTLNRQLPTIHDEIDRITRHKVISVPEYESGVSECAEAYRQGLIKSDRWQGNRNLAIKQEIHVGGLWVVYLRYIRESAEPDDLGTYAENLGAQVIKGIEGSEILRRWKEQ